MEPARYSTFIVTVNSNVVGKEAITKVEPIFKKLITETLYTPSVIKNMGEGPIYNIDMVYKFEVGTKPRGRRLHAHVEYQVRHQTRVHVDLNYIRMEGKRALGTVPYVDVSFVKTNAHFPEYVTKNLRE